jgi:hypothetical protein
MWLFVGEREVGMAERSCDSASVDGECKDKWGKGQALEQRELRRAWRKHVSAGPSDPAASRHVHKHERQPDFHLLLSVLGGIITSVMMSKM